MLLWWFVGAKADVCRAPVTTPTASSGTRWRSQNKRLSRNRVMAFQRVLEAAGVPVSIRTTRGLEAAAACGQLRNEFQKQGSTAAARPGVTLGSASVVV